MYTMRHAKEVRSMDSIDELTQLPKTVKADEVKLAKQVIGNFEGDLDLAEFKDEYQAELRRIIDAKIAGDEVVMPAEEAPTKVVNLMDALRKSLDSVGRGRKRQAKAKLPKAAKPRRVAARTTQKRKRASRYISALSSS